MTSSASAFLTGSRAYGVPREDSDVDLVVYMDPSELSPLAKALGVSVDDDTKGYPSINIKEGKLNLIVVSEPEEYDAWLSVTRKLREKAPVTRAEAILAFQKVLRTI